MKNPMQTKFSVSDYSEDSEDSDVSEQNDIINEKDQSKKLDSNSGSELDRGEQESEDESESESDSESESSSADKDEEFDHKWEELRNEAPDTDEITHRIAVCNMDWDRIRATDLLVCFNSFKPADGMINSVKIYPSEFGLQRMEEEKIKGPLELVEKTLPIDQEEDEDKKGSKYHREKLRQYQINRLKYYYAVVDCDSPETADAIYEQLNGMEYESSSVRFDLRFIPDDMTFDHKPTSVAEKVPSDYKPRLFVTSALQQVKVDLTWDETDPKRREFFQKVFTDIDSVQNDINDYLASASSESEEEEVNGMDDEESDKKMKTKDRISKYKELLKSIEDKEKKQNEEKIDVEVTWVPTLKEKTEEKVKEKIKKSTLNPFEEMLLKKKEQKKMKKKDLKKEIQDEDSEEDSKEAASALKEKTEEKVKEKIKKSTLNPFEEMLLKKEKKKMKKKDLKKEIQDEDSEEDSKEEASALKEKTEEKVKEKIKKSTLNPFEEMLLKKKEKKKMKKKDLKKEIQDQDSEEDSKEEASEISNEKSKQDKLAELALISDYKKETETAGPSSQKKKKKKKDKSDDLDGFKADMNDPRFSALHTSSLFNMVPSEHHAKKSDRNFGLKRPKEKKFKPHGFQKTHKKARHC